MKTNRYLIKEQNLDFFIKEVKSFDLEFKEIHYHDDKIGVMEVIISGEEKSLNLYEKHNNL